MEIIDKNLSFNGLTNRNSTKRIILHHSGVLARQTVETIHNYAKNTLGWAGIGYHFYVRTNGEIFRGRPENTIGAGAGGHNSDTIHICAEGNFDVEYMSETQRNSIAWLLADRRKHYNISKENVLRHKQVNSTACPRYKLSI